MLRKALPRAGLPRLRFAATDAPPKEEKPPPQADSKGAKDVKDWDPAKATTSEETVKAERSELETGPPEKGEEVRVARPAELRGR